jgi:cyclopropane fatty-acyl-phospholipid synthase-like methyltransferase
MTKRQGVSFRTIHNPDIEGAIVERFNRTLKTKMFKYFSKNNTNRYLDVINKLLTSYNNPLHSTIGMLLAKSTQPTFTQCCET